MDVELLPEEAAVPAELKTDEEAVAAELLALKSEKAAAAVAVPQPEKLSVAAWPGLRAEQAAVAVAVATDHRFWQVDLVALEHLQHIMPDNSRPWTLTLARYNCRWLHSTVQIRCRRVPHVVRRAMAALLHMLHSLAMGCRRPQ